MVYVLMVRHGKKEGTIEFLFTSEADPLKKDCYYLEVGGLGGSNRLRDVVAGNRLTRRIGKRELGAGNQLRYGQLKSNNNWSLLMCIYIIIKIHR